MKDVDVIRAWKDPEYRLSLSDAERLSLPAHPAGLIEMTDAELGAVAGGNLGRVAENLVRFVEAFSPSPPIPPIPPIPIRGFMTFNVRWPNPFGNG